MVTVLINYFIRLHRSTEFHQLSRGYDTKCRLNTTNKVIRGTEKEDFQLIVQFLKEMIGETFLFLNYYKEIPVSYEARLLSVEHDMAEFEVHEYQAKVMALEKKVLIHSHPKLPVDEDLVGEVFYVSVARRKAILTRFHYAKSAQGCAGSSGYVLKDEKLTSTSIQATTQRLFQLR